MISGLFVVGGPCLGWIPFSVTVDLRAYERKRSTSEGQRGAFDWRQINKPNRAAYAMGTDSNARGICSEQRVLNLTVEWVVRGFKEVLWPWGFDVDLGPHVWQGGREMSGEEEEEMLMRAVSVAHKDQIDALWSIWKHLHAWGFHVVPLARAHHVPRRVVVEGETREPEVARGEVMQAEAHVETVCDHREKEKRKISRRRVPRQQWLSGDDIEAATALDSMCLGQNSDVALVDDKDDKDDGMDEDEDVGGDVDKDYEVDHRRLVRKGRRDPKPRTGRPEKIDTGHRLTDRKLHLVRNTLRQCKHSAAYLGKLGQEHKVQMTRISGSLAHASWLSRTSPASQPIICESICRLKCAATLPPQCVDVDGKLLVCMPYIARIASCLAARRAA